ncbi:short-chain dehydrogenase [Heyndrickxia acidicola]|uniref:Short-chain dehydrogenase n=1 Tax=Heyndrickxia acidicola TaxID=209389 RepID=A0ABU6MJN5_9BACI|nr:short-chain dehydrogenase [Heyndrickxia acidicola]MED1204684.1 short-chain dehydrogenase [Heyndrickxia acidicola]
MHAMVIGGTGMLSEVCLNLLQAGYEVSVIGRSQERLQQLAQKADPSEKKTSSRCLSLISVDYRNSTELQAMVRKSIKTHGPILLLVSWIHSTAPLALPIILQEAAHTKEEFRLFHILGSSTDLAEMKSKINPPAHCHYRQVKLGFILESHGSRWLTNQEIASGVWNAIREDTSSIIGVVEPWEKHP